MPYFFRVLVLACFLFSALLAAAAPAGSVSLEITTRAGIQYGLARELVFAGQYTISELNWPFQPVLYAGTALAIQTRLGLSASLEVRSAFPWRSGFMQDSDYLNYEYGDLRRTHFSQHDCYTERAITLDSRVGWVFHLRDQFTLQPFAAFGLMQYKWTARDGYFQYPPEGSAPYTPWSSGQTKAPVSGTAIIYQQTYLIPALGFSASMRFGERFDAGLSFVFSPFVFCNDLDNHVQRAPPWDTDYYEYMQWGLLLEPTLTLGFRVSRLARLSLDVSYRRISGLIGDSYKVNAGPGLPPGQVAATYPDAGGAAYDALDASLALSLSL
jgi:outer membrane protease